MSATGEGNDVPGPYLLPPALEELAPDVQAELEALAAVRGYLPQARAVLARRPEVLRALNRLDEAVMRTGTVDPALKLLVAELSSAAAGCRHCQAQTAFAAHNKGASDEKIASVWEYDSSPLFNDAERAALALAHAASMTPSAARAGHFDRLREYFDEGEIVEIMSVVCLFGWNNRWNDSVATQTPPPTLEYAASVLATSGWGPGKHTRPADPGTGRGPS
ncbi:MAG TPA: carboxymuconolactone decarboxylase family protein [Acidimicrobiales bacterium]|nr:carboxymuconolactone decarboxylase family protein [Acidimicrobiales bacterium]